MKLKQLIFILLIPFLLFSCSNNKDAYLKDWDKLVERIEVKEKLPQEELDKISAEYKRLNEDYIKYKNDLTAEERDLIGRYEARYIKAYASQTTHELLEGLQGIIDLAGGFVKELTSSENLNDFKEKTLDKIVEKIDTAALSEITKNINEEQLKNVASSINKEQLKEMTTGLASIGAVLAGESLEDLDVNKLREKVSEQDLKNIAKSITPEDIETLKKTISKEDIKKLKESLTQEEIQKLKNIYKELNKK